MAALRRNYCPSGAAVLECGAEAGRARRKWPHGFKHDSGVTPAGRAAYGLLLGGVARSGPSSRGEMELVLMRVANQLDR